MGSYQKTPQKSIAKLRYFSWGSFVLSLFQLTINELIDKIVIHKPTGTKRNRIIQIDIYYNFIGKLNIEKASQTDWLATINPS